jgi:LuxR family maltose regulon positive regulatory protein
MSTPLLETKLYLPRPRLGLVPRPRLSERLDRGLAAKLLLVSAPPGFGKTTLLVDWTAALSTDDRVSTAWLSLDAGDNDPATYWAYVVAALRAVAPDVGADALAMLQETRPPPIEVVLTTLLNGLGTMEAELVLVLDDYHVIESPQVQSGMAFLLEHLPPRLHLVIASRADPALPLPRLRALGDLVEIRSADLRFTPAEAVAYLNDSRGLQLNAADVVALEERTEGWIAALQLAALSLAGREDTASFIAGFSGDDRYVVDYLVDEVLNRQPQHVRSFLLQTSVLERMNGSLCEAVTGQSGGRALLEALERDNLFVVPLDARRHWYRYHHLFADVLQTRLLDEHPDRVAGLHRSASDWYEKHGDRPEAIRHALAGGDHPSAATLVELAMPALRRDRREATMRAWLERLPDDVLRARPVLCNTLAGARLSTGTFEGVEDLLADAERLMGTDDLVVVDQDEFRRLPAALAVHRAGLALMRGDVEATVGFARRALELREANDHLADGAASALLGLAAWSVGDLEVAEASYRDCLVDFERMDHVSDVLGCSIALADIQVAQGRLRTAMRTYEAALELVSRHDGRALRGAVDMYVGLAALHVEHGDLPAARRDLDRARELGEHAGLPQNAYRSRVVMAQVRAAEGDLDAAVSLLDEAEQRYEGDFYPDIRPVAARRARLWIRQGRLDDVLAWAKRRDLSVTNDLTYVREFEHLTLARALVADRGPGAEERLAQVRDLLGRLLRQAHDSHRSGSVLEIRVVEALAHHRSGDPARALTSLAEALDLAEPEGYVGLFLDEGVAMTELLTTAVRQGGASPYLQQLLAGARVPLATPGRSTSTLVEPLSARERDILRLLRSDLSGPEIARELVVSLNTVRTHTKNVYLKLGVNSRRAAVRRAHELDLL